MKTYIVSLNEMYEGSSVIFVSNDKEKSENFAIEKLKKIKSTNFDVDVSEWENEEEVNIDNFEIGFEREKIIDKENNCGKWQNTGLVKITKNEIVIESFTEKENCL